MPHIRNATVSILSRGSPAIRRRIGPVSRRRYATGPEHAPPHPPNPNATPPSRAVRQPYLTVYALLGTYYRTFGSPVLKCFLGAVFTYQVIYYVWLKLETVEQVHEKDTEIRDLQQELKDVVLQQKMRGRKTISHAKNKIVESVKEAKEEIGQGADSVGKAAKGGWRPW